MTDAAMTGFAGHAKDISGDALDAFAGSLDGALLRAGDAGFAEATPLWNGMIKKRPPP